MDVSDNAITPRTDEERKRAKKKKSKDDGGERKKKRKEKSSKHVATRRRFAPVGVSDDEVSSAKRRCESRRQELEAVMQERKRREMQKLLGGSLAPAQSDFALKTSSLAQSSYIVNTLNPEARTLTAKYTNMLTQERLADVVFEMPGGEKAFAHIAVLLVRCPKLAEFVMSKKKKKNLKRQILQVSLPNTEEHAPPPFSRLLRFLYGEEFGITGLSLTLSTSFYLLARLYEVKEVEIKVGILIRKLLSVPYVLEVLKSACTAKDESLQEICFDFIHRNIKEVQKRTDDIAEVAALDAGVGKRLNSLNPNKSYDPYPVPNFMDVKSLQVADDWDELFTRSRPGGDLEWTCDAIIHSCDHRQEFFVVPVHKAILAAHSPEWSESWSWNNKMEDISPSFLLSVPKAKGKKHMSPRPPSPPSGSLGDKEKALKDKHLKRSVSAKGGHRTNVKSSGSLLSVSRRSTRENLAELATSKSNLEEHMEFLGTKKVGPPGEDEEDLIDQLADDCLQFLLKYVYCVAARLDVWMTFQLLTFSKKMQMYDLSSICESEIVNNMRPDTIVDTFVVAYNPATLARKDMSYLRDICHNFLLKNITAIDLDQVYAVNPQIALDSLKFHKQAELKKKHTALADVLVSDDLSIVSKLLDLNCDKGVAFALTNAFLLKDSMPSLLRVIFQNQVENNDDAFSFFRSSTNLDTMSRHILANYFNLVGTGYLVSILRPVIAAVCSQPDCWEIDENRCPAGQSVEENLKNITAVSNIFVAQLTSQQRSFPDLLKSCCTLLKEAMVGKFDEGLEEGIASFFFFNYFCPALLSPCDFGLWEGQVPPYALRGLILLSKVLNGMCSGVKFGPKEQYMTPLNSFIDVNNQKIKNFYGQMLSRSVVELSGPISLNTSSSAAPPPTTFSPWENSTSVMSMLELNLDQNSYVELLTVLNCFFVQISDHVKANAGKIELLEQLKQYLKNASELE